MNRTARLTSLHQFTATAGGTAVITDASTIADLLGMPPMPEGVRRGERWAERRSQLLDDGYLWAIIRADENGLRHVTTHTDVLPMHAEWTRVSKELLGRRRGAILNRLPAAALIGRTVVNEHGADFQVGGLYLEALTGRIVIDLLDVDEDGNPVPGTECSLEDLDGFHVY